MASGEMNEAEFTGFLSSVFRNLVGHGADGSIHFICMDWRHMGEVLAAGEEAFSGLKNLCVWAKTNGGMGSLYRSQHELVFVYKAGTGPHINNVELGRHGHRPTQRHAREERRLGQPLPTPALAQIRGREARQGRPSGAAGS